MIRLKGALSAAFILGLISGAVQVDYPWHGNGVTENALFMIGCGLGLVSIVAFLWAVVGYFKFTWRVNSLIMLPKRDSK